LGSVQILFMLLAKNLLRPGKQNFLHIMHRGAVQLHLQKPWPLPRHPNEPGGGPGILQSLYGSAFRFDHKEGRIFRYRVLSPADTWRPDERVPVTDWLGACQPEASAKPAHGDSYVPFTTWELGPFETEGYHLIAFSLEFSGETYRKLVEHCEFFTIDGPQRLLDEIEYGDIATLPLGEQGEWMRRLDQYKTEATRLDSQSYDIVVLGTGMADAVSTLTDRIQIERRLAIRGAGEAPLQPAEPSAKRFLTFNRFFSIALRYVASEAECESSMLAAQT
jgi:hypothetical protein